MILAPGHPMNGLLAFRTAVLTLAVTLVGGWACRQEVQPRLDGPALVRLEPFTGQAELLGDGVFTKRRAIRAHVPSTLSWRVRVPARGRFETHLSFARQSIDEMADLACRVRVSVGGEDGSDTVVVERRVEPHTGWEAYLADLDEWRGQEVQLSLSVECSRAADDTTSTTCPRRARPNNISCRIRYTVGKPTLPGIKLRNPKCHPGQITLQNISRVGQARIWINCTITCI